MWITKYRSNYINRLKHLHKCEIHFNSDAFKRYDKLTNNLMFKSIWNITSKIKYEQLGRIVQMFRSKASRIKTSDPRKRFITSFSNRFKESEIY